MVELYKGADPTSDKGFVHNTSEMLAVQVYLTPIFFI
jgi:hypothetical protein